MIYLTILFFLPPLLRFLAQQPLMIGTLSYYHTRLALALFEHGPIFNDLAIANGRLIILLPYHYLLAFLNIIFPPSIAAILLALTSTIGTYFLLSKIFTHLPTLNPLKNYFLFLYAISLPALVGIILPTPAAFTVFLLTISIHSHLTKHTNRFHISLFLLALHGPLPAFISTTTLFLLNRPHRIIHHLLLTTFIIITIISTLTTLPLTQTTTPLSELGGLMSTTLFTLILASMGIFLTTTRHYTLTALSLLIIILSFITPDALPFANLALTFYAATTLKHLHHTNYTNPLRWFFLTILTIGLLTQPTFFLLDTPQLYPPRDLTTLLTILTQEHNGLVLTEPSTGSLVQYYTNLPVIDDPYSTPHTKELYTAQELTQLTHQLDTLSITHILLTPTLTAQHPRFAELLNNNKTFKSVLHLNGYRFLSYQ